MSASTTADRCRLTIVASQRSIDLAVPASVPLGDVLPAIVDLLGGPVARELAGRGVVLQALGGAPLDEEQTASALGLRDGDVVYLNPRDAPAPAYAHDDLVDGVAEGIRQLPARWTPAKARAMWRTAAAVVLLLGLVGPVSGPSRASHVILAAAMAAGLLLAAGLASRALGDRAAGLILGAGSILYAAAAGLAAPTLAAPSSAYVSIAGARIAAAAAVAAAMSVAVAVVVGNLGPLILMAVVCGCATVAGALTTASGLLTAVRAAAIVVVTALLLTPLIPSLAFRLSGLRLPDLPTTAEDVTRDIEPVAEHVVAERTALTDRYVTVAYASVALVGGVGLAIVDQGHGLAPLLLSIVVIALLLLRCRSLAGAWPRWSLGAAAGAGAVGLVLRLASGVPVVPIAAFTCALGLLAAARVAESRKPRPHWGRAAEIGETVLAISLVPLTLAVLGAFGFARGLAG